MCTITKTLVSPIIEQRSITKYKAINGRLTQTNSRPGFYNVTPAESLFSKTTTLFKENIQVTGRSCEISEAVNTTIYPTGDFLSDIFRFEFQGEIELKESCLTVNGIVTNNWSFKDMAHIELPTTCSLSSEKINCGALKLTSSE